MYAIEERGHPRGGHSLVGWTRSNAPDLVQVQIPVIIDRHRLYWEMTHCVQRLLLILMIISVSALADIGVYIFNNIKTI